MVWYNLRVGTFYLKYTPLKPITKEYPYYDSEGNILKRIVEGRGKAFFVNENTGVKNETAFRLINNKPYAKLSKTKETDNYLEVDNKEIDDLIVEKQYLIDCDLLLKELKESNKSLKFGFTFGNGFKVYKAYIHTNKMYKDFLFMSVGTTQKSEVIKELMSEQKQKKKLQQIDISIQGIDRAKVEDLIAI